MIQVDYARMWLEEKSLREAAEREAQALREERDTAVKIAEEAAPLMAGLAKEHDEMTGKLAAKDAEAKTLREEVKKCHDTITSMVNQAQALREERDNVAGRNAVWCRQLNEAMASIAAKDRLLAEQAAALERARLLAYELEGGDRWPVEWDKHIGQALIGFKKASPLPEWERKGCGWKRAALPAPQPSPEGRK